MRLFPPRLATTVAIAATATLALCACAAGNPAGPAGDDPLDVVVAFYPLQFVAERVGGPSARVSNLTQPGAEAHDVELTPRQIATLSEADVVIYQKGFQPAVDQAIEQARPARVVDVSTVVKHRTTDATGADTHEHAADDTGHSADEPGHSADDGHDHGNPANVDPHVWLDPTNMVAITNATSKALGEARPAGQSAFQENAKALEGDLTRLDESFRTGLQTCARREFVVSHAAFGYLADRYQLIQIPIRGLSPDNEPSPARIAEVQQLAREHGVTTIFYETLVSPAVAESMARDLGLKTDVLDPLEGLTDQARGKDYVEVMNANLTALKAANACQ